MTYAQMLKLFQPCEYSRDEQQVQNRSDRIHDHALAYAQKVWDAMPVANREAAVRAVHACMRGQVNAVAKDEGCRALPYAVPSPQTRGPDA